MATPEDEIRDLKEKNNELVQKVQYWKMTAAQRENEKLELMKEINELRLKLSRIRSGGAAQARKLDAALQTASEEALSHLVQASGAVARTIELAKTYMRDRQELDESSPRWSNISGTPNTDRVHRVPPMMIGGQSIQPVVSLSRTLLNTSNPRSVSRSPNQNRSLTERAVPMHMLQDVYIPLTRIDAADLPNNHMETDTDANNIEDSTEDLGLDDSNERSLEESQNITEEDFEASRRLDAVTEDLEPEDEVITPPRSRIDNPLEGPSWLLDAPTSSNKTHSVKRRSNLEPDSTTELEQSRESLPTTRLEDAEKEVPLMLATSCAFSPTVRRRKRTASPACPASPAFPASPACLASPACSASPACLASPASPACPASPAVLAAPALHSPRHHARRISTSGRVLKVVVAKMRLEQSPAARASPAKRLMRFDAPSPNGSTDAGVIVSEATLNDSTTCGPGGDARDMTRDNGDAARDTHSVNLTRSPMLRDSHSAMLRDSHLAMSHDNHSVMSHDSRDSDSGGTTDRVSEGRTRRPRKAVTYKEKPLNRKMRR